MKMRPPVRALGAAALLSAIGCASPASAPSPAATAPPVRNIILLIADGAGVGQWTIARYAREDLAVERMPVVGLVDTRSASHKVTDSAAGAAAYSTGERVSNRTIAMSPACPVAAGGDTVVAAVPAGCQPLRTWFEIARDRGKATGLVTTTAVVDATPAAFVTHSPSRYWTDTIAAQIATFGPDVLMGGGRQHFVSGGRNDRRDLLEAWCVRANCLSSEGELAAYRADDRPLVGLFAAGDMDDAPNRSISLPEMVSAALSRLGRDPDGFVALFENEATDSDAHANVPLDRLTADILEFDDAVGVALEFAERNPGTLVIATGDHETGGVSLREVGRDFELAYTTGGHTAALLPIFASGPGAERFAGLIDNHAVGRELLQIVEGW